MFCDVYLSIKSIGQQLTSEPNRSQLRSRDLPYVRHLLRSHIGCPIGDLVIEVDSRGKPFVTSSSGPIAFSISHSGGVTALAIAHTRAIGVDVELDRPINDFRDMASFVLQDDEQHFLGRAHATEVNRRFLEIWTRKEASLKAGTLQSWCDLRQILVANRDGWLPWARHSQRLTSFFVVGFKYCGFLGAIASDTPISLRLHDLKKDGFVDEQQRASKGLSNSRGCDSN